MMKCVHCGEENTAEARYCVACGKALLAPAAVAAPEQVVVRLAVPLDAQAVDLWLTVIAIWLVLQALGFLGGALVLRGFASALGMVLGALSGGVGTLAQLGMAQAGTDLRPMVGLLQQSALLSSVLALLLSIAGVLAVAAAIGLLRRRSWARVVTLVEQGLAVMIAFLGLLQAPSAVGVWGLLEAAVVAGLIWVYLQQAAVRQALHSEG
jgi:hypothetical protein